MKEKIDWKKEYDELLKQHNKVKFENHELKYCMADLVLHQWWSSKNES